ncbi:hypothetical protein [Austwickia chelonae]|uniref:hypothetical protein n=1 Tax=Austwickia chelonae TaxID=100225 RepID=UPI000E245876|nr:hypothetical protein [Austwickia chelonae]
MTSSSTSVSASRRTLLQRGGLGAAIAAASAMSGCSGTSEPSGGSDSGSAGEPSLSSSVTSIGDGSTVNTGPQSNQPKVEKLTPGQVPPQFVVISWDGAAGKAGHEIGAHFNGHFCGTKGVAAFSEADWSQETVIDAFLAGFDRACRGNRAPLIIGNHFEQWNGGIYMDAVETVMREVSCQSEVRFVSFRQLVDWMEAQESTLLTALQALLVGQASQGGGLH